MLYLELTRSKSVISGSQPALHSYVNKPRRSCGKEEGHTKAICCLLVTATPTMLAHLTTPISQLSFRLCKYEVLWSVSQDYINIKQHCPHEDTG